MTRAATVGVMKGRGGCVNVGQPPRSGTKLRALYDALYAKRGLRCTVAELVEVIGTRGNARLDAVRVRRYLDQLTDEYGCDVRRMALVGETCGRVYVDYVTERMAAAERDE